MLEILAPKILEKAGESAVRILEQALKRENDELVKRGQRATAQFATTTTLTRDALAKHIDFIRSWASTINFSDLEERKSVSQIYVDVDTYLVPLNRHATHQERTKVQPLLGALIAEKIHSAILGSAGAGKTTALKKICLDYFTKGRVLLNYNFPLLIELRDLTDSASAIPLYDKIQEILAVRVIFPKDKGNIPVGLDSAITKKVVSEYIDALGAALILDGYDEISDATIKTAVLNDFDSLSKSLRHSRIIMTSRSGDFSYSGEMVRRFEIAPLTIDQVGVFAHRWLKSKAEAEDFLQKVKASPFADTTIRPLTVAQLCAIYERIKDIPDKPKSVYRRIVNLLLKEWDEQRRVKRVSAYSGFDVDRKFEFLAHLAFSLTTDAALLRFSSDILKDLYKKIHADHGLPAKEAATVIQEIESHNGLIVKSGYDYYEFAHKSLQEFLAADYIVRLPSLAGIVDKFHLLPNELAIATALSSKPGEFLCALVSKAHSAAKVPTSWYASFSTRLVLEKPELTIGHTAFTTISILQLATHSHDPERLGSILRNMLPLNTLKSLSRFYKVQSKHDGIVELVRLPTHMVQEDLPRNLVVPGSMLR